MTKYDESTGIFTFVDSGAMYHASRDFVKDALRDAGCILHSTAPFQIIDKVGFLKTEAESLDFTRDILREVLRSANEEDAHPSQYDSAYNCDIEI